MPVVIGAVLVLIEVDDARGLRIIHRIKQQELGPVAEFGKYAEIGSPIRQSGTKGKATTGPTSWRLGRGIDCALRQVPQHYCHPGWCDGLLPHRRGSHDAWH